MEPQQQDRAKSLTAQVLPVFMKRRYRTVAAVAILFLMLWMYHGFAQRSVVPLPSHQFGSQEKADGPALPLASPPPAPEPTSIPVEKPTAETHSHLEIPRKIWQIMLPRHTKGKKQTPDPKVLEDTPSWLIMNPDYEYKLVGEKGADEFVSQHFADKPAIVETYQGLQNLGMKSDLLRYLILDVEGGVYTDTDTIDIKPIDEWVPAHLKGKVGLIVGIEFDRRDGGPWAEIPHWLQFCQWTIAAAPGHPVFPKMVSHILEAVERYSSAYQVPVNKLNPTSFEVMNSTGPAAWTDVVFEQLQEYEPTLKELKDLSFMTEPKLHGDILVLSINGFGMGQRHSHSTNDGTIPKDALMKHLFRGSWRG
ncbi:unnamed protein product [Clonostachys rosea f. rosea IK726]|uniref:Uncharacterized protein n=1 Tax=Clonostachys rosea f. rosea IK726 TaxID=1349383 RepID=A0ACA9TWN6_BIOOC|nr:unnamed protein product [Clonostachys rosea f. rosea IK726]